LSENIGRRAAHLHWHEGLSWNEVARQLDTKRERARSAARHYKKNHPDEFADPDLEQVTQDQHHNTATVESKSARIKTLDQLLEACEVDLDIWRVDHYLINKWEVGAKSEWKNLHYKDGKATGDVRSEGLQVEPLFQVKAWLIRHKPEPIFPTIQPIECVAEYTEPARGRTDGIARALIWADPHFGFTRNSRTAGLRPFHNRQALDAILQIAHEVQPDRVDILGDLLDLAEWTDRFLRSPEFQECTQPALLEAHWWLAQMRGLLPDAQIVSYEDNHDRRMDDAIITHLRAAYDLRAADEMELPPALSMPKLLALHKLGIEWVDNYPDGEAWLNDRIRLSHGDIARGNPGDTAKAVVRDADTTEIFGHVHRIEWVSRTKWDRGGNHPIIGVCAGCTCWIDGRVPGKTARQQWQNGCAIVEYKASGEYSIFPIRIDRGVALWNGKEFQGQDRLEDLRKDLPGWRWQ